MSEITKSVNYNIVYKHEINNKVYIGITKYSMEQRLKGHINAANRGSMTKFHQSIRKYGLNNIYSEVLEEGIPDEEIVDREKYWIHIFDSVENGLNGNSGGRGMAGGVHSIKAKKKMSEFHSGKVLTEEHKKKISERSSGKNNGMYGKKHSEESKMKMSEIHKGKTISDEQKMKMSESLSGIKKNMKLFVCPHCGLEGKGGNMTRYHFDNCKHKED